MTKMTVQEVEALLEKTKKDAEIEERTRIYQELKSSYEGKCYASHTFTRRSKSGMSQAKYIESIYMDSNNDIYAKIWNIYINKNKYSNSVNFGISNTQLTDQSYSPEYTLTDFIMYLTKEITLDKFKNLWQLVEHESNILDEELHKKLSDIYGEPECLTSIQEGKSFVDFITNYNIDVVDFYEYPEIYNLFKYTYLPFYYQNRWMPVEFLTESLDWYIDKLKRENSTTLVYKVIEFNNKRIKTIQDFKTLIAYKYD